MRCDLVNYAIYNKKIQVRSKDIIPVQHGTMTSGTAVRNELAFKDMKKELGSTQFLLHLVEQRHG